MHDNLQTPTGNIDYDGVAALQQKRTLAFVNHFILTTVQFMNNFAKQCEHKLMYCENKLEKINASMVLLETRLQSLPEVNDSDVMPITDHINKESEINTSQSDAIASESVDLEEKPAPSIKTEYMKFVKMVQVGVPIQAVKLKISLEGLDPNELDTILKG